jgi:hypothetical protein
MGAKTAALYERICQCIPTCKGDIIFTDVVPVVVLTIFTIVDDGFAIFPPPHNVRFWVPGRLARERHVSCLPDNHICAGFPVHYRRGNWNKNRKFWE